MMARPKGIDPTEVVATYRGLKSLKDTAATLGTSPSTISYHLNGTGEVVLPQFDASPRFEISGKQQGLYLYYDPLLELLEQGIK